MFSETGDIRTITIPLDAVRMHIVQSQNPTLLLSSHPVLPHSLQSQDSSHSSKGSTDRASDVACAAGEGGWRR